MSFMFRTLEKERRLPDTFYLRSNWKENTIFYNSFVRCITLNLNMQLLYFTFHPGEYWIPKLLLKQHGKIIKY